MKKRSRKSRRTEVSLQESATPLFLLDDKRAIVFFNAGCETLTGWTSDDVLGIVCDYVSESTNDDVPAIAAALCPPPEVLAGRIVSVPADLPRRSGKPVPRVLHFFPLVDDEGRVGRILGIATVIGRPSAPNAVTPAQKLHAELAALRSRLRRRYGIARLVVGGDAMDRVLQQIELARCSTSWILLQGEAGTGKEHVARLIHHESDSAAQTFVPVDCAATPARELKGMFRRLFEATAETPSLPGLTPSVLYLANVESLPRDLQEMLIDLSAGDGSAGEMGIRIIAATSGDVREQFAAENLRADFFYRLTALSIDLPPLRRRLDHLGILAQAFLESGNEGSPRQIGGFSPAVIKQFQQYGWPGNLDELKRVVEESAAACTGTLIDPGDLPFRFRTGFDAQSVCPLVQPSLTPLEPYLRQIETDHIRQALESVRYNKTRAAKLLGIPRAKLYRRMTALGIEDREDNSIGK